MLSPLLLLMFTAITVQAESPFVVIVDPGHGGKDHGAMVNEIKESAIVLAVGQSLAAKLNSEKNFRAFMTRSEDRFLTLSERTQFARQHKGNLFLSIHVNSSPDANAHGVEIYFRNQLPPDQESMYLAARENLSEATSEMQPEYSVPGIELLSPEVANIIHDLADNTRARASSILSKSLRSTWLGLQRPKYLSIKQAPFFVISNLDMPSNLVELGFLSHAQEATQIVSPEYQKRVAQSLYDGILLYKDSIDKTP